MRSVRVIIGATFALAVWACGSSDGGSGTTTGPGATAFTVELDSGIVDSATVFVGQTIPFRVKVVHSGAPAASMSVSFTVQTGHGLLSSASAVTDSLGIASVQWTMGDTVGLNTAAATSGDGSATLRAVAIGQGASALARASADTSTVVATSTVSLSVRAIDGFGNPVPNVTVTWSAPAGALSVTSTTTGASGNAQTNFTTPAAPGTYTVTATLPGQASITFTVIAL